MVHVYSNNLSKIGIYNIELAAQRRRYYTIIIHVQPRVREVNVGFKQQPVMVFILILIFFLLFSGYDRNVSENFSMLYSDGCVLTLILDFISKAFNRVYLFIGQTISK